MKYSTKYINRNYRIKVYGISSEGKRINTLVGVAGFIALVGVDFVNKFIDRAERSMEDSTTCKLRRGIVITLYAK